MTTSTLTLSTLPFEKNARLPTRIGGMSRVCQNEETFDEAIASLIEQYGDAPLVETHWRDGRWDVTLTKSKRYFLIETERFRAADASANNAVANYYASLGYKGD